MTLGISITIFKWSKLAFYPCLLGQYFFPHDFQQVTALSTTTFCVVMERDGGYTCRYYIVYSFIQLFIIFVIIIIVLFIIFGRNKTGNKIVVDMLCDIVIIKGRRLDIPTCGIKMETTASSCEHT